MIDEIIQSGIISVQDAQSLLGKAVFLDATFVLPTSDEDVKSNYLKAHIPEARFFDIKDFSDPQSQLPSMLPNKEHFERLIRGIGIHNNDLIIVYGQHGMIMGPARVWWMLRGFGHQRIVVLDGGLPAWLKAGYDVHQGEVNHIAAPDYCADGFDKEQVLDIDDMIHLSDSGACPILDARPQNRYTGEVQEPRAGMRSGHIPNSASLPCSGLVDADGCFKNRSELSALFADTDLSGRIALTCGSGITACALALALYHLGHQNSGVYDGSWSEWGLEKSGTRVET